MKTVLMVTTSHNDLAGHPTGVWLEEYAVPFAMLERLGIAIVVASPQGGIVPIDPRSAPTPEQESEWQSAIAAAQNARLLGEMNATDFDAIFIPGGHGPMFDLPDNPDLIRLLADFEAQQKIIAAVCHGPVGLLNARRGDGEFLVKNRRVTAYTAQEEVLAKLDKSVPFILEDALRERGALFESGGPKAAYAVRDGALITGQNPASSALIATELARALGESP